MNPTGDYGYQNTSFRDVIEKRENSANEFLNFYEDLKSIKNGTLNGFVEYIQVKFRFLIRYSNFWKFSRYPAPHHLEMLVSIVNQD